MNYSNKKNSIFDIKLKILSCVRNMKMHQINTWLLENCNFFDIVTINTSFSNLGHNKNIIIIVSLLKCRQSTVLNFS